MKKLFAVIFSLFMFAFVAHGQQLVSGGFDEINGSLPAYYTGSFGTTTYSGAVSYGLYGSITGTGVYQPAQGRTTWGSHYQTETPTNAEYFSAWVYISSVADSDREIGVWLDNITRGTSLGFTLDATDLNSTGWYHLQCPAYDYMQYGITYFPGWTAGDDYGMSLSATDVGTFYFDNLEMGTLSTKSTVSGPSSAYVTAAALPNYTANFSGVTGKYAYKWEIHSGPNAHIVSGGTSRTVTIDFDAYGGYQISLKVKNTSTSTWSDTQLKSHTVYPSY